MMMIMKKMPKRSLFHKSTKDNDKDFDENDEEEYTAPVKQKSSFSNNKVTPMRQPSRRSSVNMEVCVIKPTSVEDSREITETLLSGRTVILNLEGLDLEIAQRIIDFISGSDLLLAVICRRFSNLHISCNTYQCRYFR